MVIFLSIVLVVLDIFLTNKTFSNISKILRGIFRFLRIFLLFRKVTQFKNLRKFYSNYNVRSPLEKCLEILNDARISINDTMMLKDIEWCMEMLSSNKLYDPLSGFKKNEEDGSAGPNGEVNDYFKKIIFF